MSTKIDAELSRHLREAESSEPDRQIPVIVTLAEGGNVAELERRGLKVAGRVDSISVAYGTLAASKVGQIESLDFVRLIEYDSRASALSGSQL